MNRKRKTDKPALSFADSSVQGRSTDGEYVNEGGSEECPQRTRNSKITSKWLEAVADSGDGEDVSSDENFVTLLPIATRRSGRNKREKDDEWKPEENEVQLLEDDVAVDDDDDDFEPSTSGAVKKPQQNQRKHLLLKRERERLKRQKEEQDEAERLAAQDEADLMKAIELSRIEMEEKDRLRKREEDFLAGIQTKEEEDVSNGSSQRSGRMANCNSTYNNDIEDDAGAIPGSSVTGDFDPEDIGSLIPTKRRPIHRSSQEMERPGQSSTNHSQELIDPDLEDATQMTGGIVDEVRNSQSPSMFSTPDDISLQNNNEMISSTSGVSPITRPKQQETIDQSLVRATRLGLRKRPLPDVQTTTYQPLKIHRSGVVPEPPEVSTLDEFDFENDEERTAVKPRSTTRQTRKSQRAVVVPQPPEISTLDPFDEFNFDNEDRRRVVKRERQRGNGSGLQGSAGSGDGSQKIDAEDFPKNMNPPECYDPGQPLVDTRNQPDQPSFYSPKGTCVKNYTKVILKLLHHYCLRLRKSQTKSAPRVEAGTPVMQGQYFAGTLRHKKRGVKPPMPVYDLSDDEDNVPNNASQDEWKSAMKPNTNRLSIKDIVGTRKRKRPNVIEDSDSDLDDFKIGNLPKTQKTLNTNEVVGVKDFDVDIMNVNENVPLFQLECIATIAGSDRKRDVSPKPCTRSRPDDSPTIAGTSRKSDTGVTTDHVENQEDASQTLAYDDIYEAETEEFVTDDNRPVKSSASRLNEADTVVDNKSKAPSTSRDEIAPSKSVDKSSSPVMSQEAHNDKEHTISAGDHGNQQEDRCLVDSTTLSVLRKSRKLKRKAESHNSQTSHEGGAVTSSENQENIHGRGCENANQSTEEKTTPCASSVSVAETVAKESKARDDVEELASTSDIKSTNVLSKRRSDNVETTSESSQETRRVSPVSEDVSSMPKMHHGGDVTTNSEVGVSSSKETTPQKRTSRHRDSRSSFEPPPQFVNHSFEEVRFKFYAQREQDVEGSETEEGYVSENNHSESNVDNDLSKEDLKRTILDVCSDVLPTASVSEGVSSSLPVKVAKAPKHSHDKTKNSTMQVELDGVASTSDNSKGKSARGKPSDRQTTDRQTRHQSPGVASSSDDQHTSVKQRTVVESDDVSDTSSASDITSQQAERKKRQSLHSGEEVETTSSDATSKQQKVVDRTVPSIDEAETSTSDSVSRKRDARTRQKTTTSEAEVKMTSSSSSSTAAADVSASKIISKKTDLDVVESSGLDLDAANGPSLVRSRMDGSSREDKIVGIGSSNDPTVSEDHARKTAKVAPNRRGSDEASTSADVQPVNHKESTKEREALPRVSREQADVQPVINKEPTKEREALPRVSREQADVQPVIHKEPTKEREALPRVSREQADVQPVIHKEPTKEREALPRVSRQQESTDATRGRRTPKITGALSQSDGDGHAGDNRGPPAPPAAASSNDGDSQEAASISVECPLCRIQFPIQQIEAHASECDGPPEQDVVVVPRNTRRQQLEQIPRTTAPRADDDDEEIRDGDDEVDLSEEFSFPNSNYNTERKQPSHRKPVHTYSRRPNSNATATVTSENDVMGDDWLAAGNSSAPRPNRVHISKIVSKPADDDDEEDESNDVTHEMDHVDAAIYQMVENDELHFVEPRRATRGSRNAQRRSPSPEEEEEEVEPNEKCFLCNKLIPRSLYEAHVNEEIDRMQNQGTDDSSEGASGPAGEAIQTGLVRRTRRTEVQPKPKDKTEQRPNTAADSDPEIIDDDFDDYDDDSDDDEEKPFDPANVSFGDSPIRAFKKISEQPNNLIDFKNQFKASNKPVKSLYKETGKGRGKRKAYRGKRGRGKRRR